MTPFLRGPDIEAIAANAIRNASIPGLNGVYSSIPKKPEPVYPLITVARDGGEPAVRQYLDAGVIEVRVWGGTKSEIQDIAQRARVALLELEGTTITSPVRAVISGVDDARGLRWEPDELTGKDRYIFMMTIFARSN